MTQNNLKSNIGILTQQKRRGVAEVISTLLLVVITVVGAVILTSFIDESFVSGSLAVSSGTDTSIKTIRLLAYDTRNGDLLMDPAYLIDNNEAGMPGVLCRELCASDTNPTLGGSDFMVIQIENRGIHPIFLKAVNLDGVTHIFDEETMLVDLDATAASPAGGVYPSDGTFSILPGNGDLTQTTREITGGATANLLIKLHANDIAFPDIQLSKTMRVQVNIGASSSLSDFLIETGDTR